MTYLVLARKWRPRSFDTLVGQDHVVRALSQALNTQRLHHAWLFTGTRGVGKTTLSRILAKALNCQQGITATPCNECPACTGIDADRFVDYLELDAASNRGVEEMTRLLDQAVYAPSAGRFKVYMIDEVHMLTGHAFNAMLKTLEEPPPHVKFILATTDPQKIPVTVLSRCLQFNLKQMPPDAISGHLQRVLEAEDIPAELPALRLIGQAAQGSMRDALSLTDQAIAYSGGNVSEDAVRGMLGAIDQQYLVRLLDALAANDGAGMVAVADELAARSLSYASALGDLAGLLSQIAMAQRIPGLPVDDTPLAEDIRRLAGLFSPDAVQLFYSIALHSRPELALAPDEYAGFVMACLRMLAFAGEPQELVAMPSPGPVSAAPGASPGRRQASSTASAATRPAADASAATSLPGGALPGGMPPSGTPPGGMPPSGAPSGGMPDGLAAARAAAALLQRGAQRRPAGEPRVQAPQATQAPQVAAKAAAPAMPPSARTPSAGLAVTRPVSTSVAVQSPSASGGAEASSKGPPWQTDEVRSRSVPEVARPAAAVQSRSPDEAVRQPATRTQGSREPEGYFESENPAPPDWETEADFAQPSRTPSRPASTGPGQAEVPSARPGMARPGLARPGHAASGRAGTGLSLSEPWPVVATRLPLRGMAAELARQAEWVGIEGNTVILKVATRALAQGPSADRLRDALAGFFGQPVQLRMEVGETGSETAYAVEQSERQARQKQAEQAIENDDFVRTLVAEFGGEVVPGSIRPV